MSTHATENGFWSRFTLGRLPSLLALALAFVLAPGLGGCVVEDGGEGEESEDVIDPGGKADSMGGFSDPGWNVWEPIRAWADIAPNGETYEQYFATWLASVQYDDSGYRGEDVKYLMGDGTALPAPKAECSDTAIFLRLLYAEEHGLPCIIYGGQEIFGHFGWLDKHGSRKRSYSQYQLNAPRGSDATLQGINRYQPDREQNFPFEGATTGQYLDALLTNKRFGVFMQDVWNMLYSGNVGERANTYYIKPEFIRGGDVQLHRSHPWDGIGHTITIQRVHSLNGFLQKVDLIQSYMPTYPWVSDGYSELTSYRPDPENNSGLRRWRTPVLRNGRWYVEADQTVGQPSSTVETNPEQFEELFSVTPQEQVQALLDTINAQRIALVDNPNSCRRREDRENAFETLYELYVTIPELYQPLGFDAAPTHEQVRPAVDRLHRTIDDFIFAAMHYERAWVCHWNPSDKDINNSMYAATVAHNQQVALAEGCQSLRIFRSENVDQYDGSDGFDDLAAWATSNGYQWDPYYLDPSEGDEGGALRSVVTDELADPGSIDYFCSIFADLQYWAP